MLLIVWGVVSWQLGRAGGLRSRLAQSGAGWARNAEGIKLVCSYSSMEVQGCISLVSCLPALENVRLRLVGPLIRDDLGCLLDALAWCPRLGTLNLATLHEHQQGGHVGPEDLYWPFPGAPAFAKLRSLTKLVLSFDGRDPFRWPT